MAARFFDRHRWGISGVKAGDFIVSKRPRLGSITKHGKVEFPDYERQLAAMQTTVQAIQQALPGDARAGSCCAGGVGYGRQRRHRASPWMGVRSPQLQGSPHWRAILARTGQTLSSAVLGKASGARSDRRFRPFVVWAGPGGACRGPRHNTWMAEGLRSTNLNVCW